MSDDRGHLKVFIGMAPGVGKTYRMLREGVAEADSGRDVVVGYLEPHGRAETAAQAGKLEIVPRRTVIYRGRQLEEMDLPAVLERKPELCLIDELAHTNAPGLEHEKRYEDVRDVLEAGIDVYSTVNVQHLESLNDQVTQLTGTRVRETIPDEVLSSADEVVLIDLTPEALIARLRAGKVYPRERVPAALNSFFKVENLAALRETALRQVAEDVEVKRLLLEPSPIVRRDEAGLPARAEAGPQPISERLLALATLDRHSERVVRRAWRSAQRLDAELDVLVVRPPGRPPSPEDRGRIEELRRLTAMLGARLRVEEGEDVAAVAISVARAIGATYVVMGPPGFAAAWPVSAGRAPRGACSVRSYEGCRGLTCSWSPTRRCADRPDPRRRVLEGKDSGGSATKVSEPASAGSPPGLWASSCSLEGPFIKATSITQPSRP